MILIFYLGAVVFSGLGALLLRHTPLYTRVGGSKYERRMMRRTLGVIVLVAGAWLLGLVVLRQFTSSIQ